MEKEKKFCPYCNKFLVPYLKSSDVCQICYRKILEEYGFYDYKDESIKPNEGTKAFAVCELSIKENLDSKVIGDILNCSKIYVAQIRRKFLNRVNADGKIIPKYIKE